MALLLAVHLLHLKYFLVPCSAADRYEPLGPGLCQTRGKGTDLANVAAICTLPDLLVEWRRQWTNSKQLRRVCATAVQMDPAASLQSCKYLGHSRQQLLLHIQVVQQQFMRQAVLTSTSLPCSTPFSQVIRSLAAHQVTGCCSCSCSLEELSSNDQLVSNHAAKASK